MTNKEEIKEGIINRFKKNGWFGILKGYLLGEPFDRLVSFLIREVETGNRFTPMIKHAFKPFDRCSYDECNVVMLWNSYEMYFDSDAGLVLPDRKLWVSDAIIAEIDRTCYEDKGKTKEFDQFGYASQGVLMLRVSLTDRIGKKGTHIQVWNPFITYLLDVLDKGDKDLIWAFVGKEATSYSDLVDADKYEVSFPENNWDCGDLFNKINSDLESKEKSKIIW